jgi:hypothetical protein
MRIAFALFGQPRDYIRGYETIKQYLEKQGDISVDFFYHCWTLKDTNKPFAAANWRKIDEKTLVYNEKTPEDLYQYYKPVAHMYEHQEDVVFDESIYNTSLVYKNTPEKYHKNIKNILYQTYSRNKVRDVVHKYVSRTGTHYDFVVLTRFDICSFKPLPTLKFEHMEKDCTYISPLFRPRFLFPDTFLIMPMPVFLSWFDIFETLSDLLNNEENNRRIKTFGESAVLNGEELLFLKYMYHYKSTDKIRYY